MEPLRTQAQSSLGFEHDTMNDDPLRAAWARSGLPIPYHIALRDRALVVCLRNLSEVMQTGLAGKPTSFPARSSSPRMGRKSRSHSRSHS